VIQYPHNNYYLLLFWPISFSVFYSKLCASRKRCFNFYAGPLEVGLWAWTQSSLLNPRHWLHQNVVLCNFLSEKNFFQNQKIYRARIIAYGFWIKVNLITLHWIKSRGESKKFSRGFGAEPPEVWGQSLQKLTTFEDLLVQIICKHWNSVLRFCTFKQGVRTPGSASEEQF